MNNYSRAVVRVIVSCFLLIMTSGFVVHAQETNSSSTLEPCTFIAPDPTNPSSVLIPTCLRPDNIPTFEERVLSAGAGENLKLLISFITGGIATLSGILAVVFIIYHGLILTVSGGDEGKRGDSLKKIQWAIIGLIGVIFAYVVVNVTLDVVTTVGTPPREQQPPNNPGNLNTGSYAGEVVDYSGGSSQNSPTPRELGGTEYNPTSPADEVR